MYVQVDSVTPFDNLRHELEQTRMQLERIDTDLLYIQTEKKKLQDNLLSRIFQRGRIASFESQENTILNARKSHYENLINLEQSFNNLKNADMHTEMTPKNDLIEKLQELADKDGLFFNDYLELEVKLKPENYSRYDAEMINEFIIEDYDIEATVDILTVSYNDSFSSVAELYNKIKEEGGMLRYTENEQVALKEQIREILETGQYRLTNEGEVFTAFTINDNSLERESSSNRLSFSRMTQDLTTGVLEISFEDNYLNTNYATISYDESEGVWRSDDVYLHESAVDSLNRLVHVDHSMAFEKFYEKLSEQERTYITLLNEANREALDNEYVDYFKNRSTNKADQLAQFKKEMNQERIDQLNNVYRQHVHMGLPITSDPVLVNMDQLHLITSKYDEVANATKFINAARSEIGGLEKLEKAIEQAEFEPAFSGQKISEPQKVQAVEASDRTQEQRRADMIEKMDNKEEVLSLYTKYLSGEKLTYTERTSIVQYDQANGSFEQMQLRLEGLGRAMFNNPDVDFREKEDTLMLARGEDEALQEIISKEYYDMSINERVEVKEAPDLKNAGAEKEHSKVSNEPGFMNYEEITKIQLKEELTIVQNWINSYSSDQVTELDKDFFKALEISSGDGAAYFVYPLDDGVDIVDTLTQDISEILSYKFSEQPNVLSDTRQHLFEQLGLNKEYLYEQLAEEYGIKGDMAFSSGDYKRIFGDSAANSEKEILTAINQQRSEKMFDWVYNETYPVETINQYKEELILNLQKKIIDGHKFYQVDEQMELMIQPSKEIGQGFEGTIFKEVGGHETFTVKDSKAAAERMANMSVSPCSKNSMSILKQFLSEDNSREHQQHLVHNNVMRETYQEETGRSMTGRR